MTIFSSCTQHLIQQCSSSYADVIQNAQRKKATDTRKQTRLYTLNLSKDAVIADSLSSFTRPRIDEHVPQVHFSQGGIGADILKSETSSARFLIYERRNTKHNEAVGWCFEVGNAFLNALHVNFILKTTSYVSDRRSFLLYLFIAGFSRTLIKRTEVLLAKHALQHWMLRQIVWWVDTLTQRPNTTHSWKKQCGRVYTLTRCTCATQQMFSSMHTPF